MTAMISARNGFVGRLSWTAAFALLLIHVPVTYAVDWHIEQVDTTGNVGQGCSLALDDSEYPHISYYHGAAHDELRYAFWDGSGWQIVVVDDEPWNIFGACTSLQLDTGGNPHIAYFTHGVYPGQGAIRYTYKDSTGWHIEEVTPDPDYYHCVLLSLDLDGMEYPHVAIYREDEVRELDYIYKDTSGWHQDLDVCPSPRNPSLVLDSDDNPHIASHASPQGMLVYAHKDISGWQYEGVDSEGWDPSLALDEDGYPRIAYTKNEDIWYCYKDGSGWEFEIVAGSTANYEYDSSCLQLDGQGYQHISFVSYSLDPELPPTVRYVFKNASGWQWAGWISPGEDPSLALEVNSVPHISYYDGTNGDLKYASPTIILSGTVEAGQLVLTWSEFPWALAFRVHGEANNPYLQPTPQNLIAHVSQTWTWSSPNGIGDPNSNWTYLVLGLNASGEIARSNYCGEHDFFTLIP